MTETLADMEPTVDPPPAALAPRLEELEARVRRLEVAHAERPPTNPTEAEVDAMADRVVAKLAAMAGARESAPDRVLVLDSAATGPVAVVPVPTPAASTPEQPPPPPNGAVLQPPAPPTDPAQRKWFLTQLWSEVRLILRMYFDPRYRVSRTTQLALPGIVLLLVFNYFFFAVWVNILFVSPVVERVLAVLLGILAYKLLTRETTRYRGVLEYLARYGQR